MKHCLECGGRTKIGTVEANAMGDMRRRRECYDCGEQFITIEVVAGPHPRAMEVAKWASEQNRALYSPSTGEE